MLRLGLKGALARKLRLALTAIAIVLGVAFVAGTYVLTDTINATFDTLFNEVYAGIDVTVRGDVDDLGGAVGAAPERVGVSQEVLDAVTGVEGVEVAIGFVDGYAQLVDADGDAVGGNGPPTLGFSWTDEGRVSPVRIREGQPPQAAGEVVIDAATADMHNFAIGDAVTVLFLGGPEEFEITGVVSFGDSDGLAGATLSLFELETARRVLEPPGDYTSISVVAEPGVSQDELATRVQAVVTDDSLGVFTGEEETENQLDEVRQGLGFLGTALLVFAFIAVFVGAFIIQNTFRIIVAQRTREMALLRAVGASRNQVIWLVVVEALVVAVIASLIGIAAGIGFALLIKAGMNAVGFGLPEGPLTVLPRTFAAGMAVGILVTLVSAVIPAFKASRVPPVAAMREVRPPPRSLRRRALAGAVVVAAGAGGLVLGLATNQILWVGLGALVAFLGVSVLAPLAAKPVGKILGWPLPRLFGVTGTLAKENAIRRPRRTAATASALMIGVALVAFVGVFSESIKASVSESVFDNFPAEYLIQPANFDGGVPREVAARLGAAAEVETVSAVRFGATKIDGETQFVAAVDADTIEDVFTIGVAEGDLAGIDDGGIVISEGAADKHDWVLGDDIAVEFPLTGTKALPVVGIIREDDLSAYVVSLDTYDANFSNRFDHMVFVNGTDVAEPAVTRAVIDTIADEYVSLTVEDKSEFVRAAEEEVDQLLVLIQGLLFLAVLIAVLGITNTLALSVVERTREIGLLRAVGLDRRRTRRMIRWEAVVVAVFGALLGVVLGVIFGWAILQEISGLDVFRVPVSSLVVYVVLAGLAGMLAAVLPARKAARMNVLEAIAYE